MAKVYFFPFHVVFNSHTGYSAYFALPPCRRILPEEGITSV
ncbi:MAG: hypothetical protein E7616_05835 [Ruminococcaceae bacterium]|nr:hypothetical protein [Oscillospiraceae bacterium]